MLGLDSIVTNPVRNFISIENDCIFAKPNSVMGFISIENDRISGRHAGLSLHRNPVMGFISRENDYNHGQ